MGSTLLGVLVLAGCTTSNFSETTPEVGHAGARITAPSSTEVTPAQLVSGQVVRVDSELKFVVVDFGLNPVPKLGTHLGVYRQGLKVGEVTLTGPVSNSNVAADISAGQVQLGDEVRAE